MITDIGQLSVLIDSEERLWPAVPERVLGDLGMDAWLARARRLAFRLENNAQFPSEEMTILTDANPLIKPWLEDLQRELEAMCYQEEGGHEMGPGGRREIDECIARIQAIEKAQRDFIDLSGGTKRSSRKAAGRALKQLHQSIARVGARRQRALDGDPDHHTEAWRETFAWLATELGQELYKGVDFTQPIPGLIPLGPDPDSGLLEFSWLPSGEVAQRDSEGQIQIQAEMGIVLVLLRGGLFQPGAVPVRSSDEQLTTSRIDPEIALNAHIDSTPSGFAWLSPFLISKYEVTQAQWFFIETRNPSFFLGKRDIPLALHPVEEVTLSDCHRFCARLGLELPTDAQWEFAARSGTDTCWWFGNETAELEGLGNISDLALAESLQNAKINHSTTAFFNDGYGETTAPIGQYRPNHFGLHDMIGNVNERCQHSPAAYIRLNDQPNANIWTKLYGNTSLRGGSYTTSIGNTRSAVRTLSSRGSSSPETGLRPVMTLRNLEVPR